MNQKLINYILELDGDVSKIGWYNIGKKFNIKPPNKIRAKNDPKYNKRAIAREAQRIWQSFKRLNPDLTLVKEVYKEGKIHYQTYKQIPEEELEINKNDFEIVGFTTNPHGNGQPWARFKRKEPFLDEDHLEEIKKYLKKETPRIIDKSPKITINNNKTLIAYGADKHIGALVKKNSIYTNKYDKKEIERRLIKEFLLSLIQEKQKHGKFKRIIIMDLGDALDGFNQKTTGGLRGTSSHTLPQCMNNREQFDCYIETHKKFFDELVKLDLGKDIYFIATCNSNHGGDFEYTAFKYLEGYLNIVYPQIKTYVSVTPFNHIFFDDHCLIYGHGKDDEDMKKGLPLILDAKVIKYFTTYIKKNKIKSSYVHVATADLHQTAETSCAYFRYRKVLSQFGSSKWMHTNYGPGSPGISIEVYSPSEQDPDKKNYFFKNVETCTTGMNI